MHNNAPSSRWPDIARTVFENGVHTKNAAVPLHVRLRDGAIEWRLHPVDQWEWPFYGFIEGEAPHDVLWKFLDLARATDEGVLDFVSRFGVLGIRPDGMPGTAPLDWLGGDQWPEAEWEGEGRGWRREPVATIRMYADSLKGVVAFSRELRESPYMNPDRILEKYDLHQGAFSDYGLPEMKDEDHVTGIYMRWAVSCPLALAQGIARQATAEARRGFLSWFITNQWIAPSSLVPTLTWENNTGSMRLAMSVLEPSNYYPESTLFRLLASQLSIILTSEPFERLDVCAVCNRLFVPAIKPGRHARSFCPDHKLQGEQERKRRWARKMAAERKAKRES